MELNEPKFLVTARLKEFSIPPITDGVVIGKDSPIGVSALQKALRLLIPEDFDLIEVPDEVVGSILLRRSISRRLTQKRIVPFLLKQVKPLMLEDDILHVQLETEFIISQEL